MYGSTIFKLIIIIIIIEITIAMKHYNSFLNGYKTNHHTNNNNNNNNNQKHDIKDVNIKKCIIMLNSNGMTSQLIEPIWNEFSLHICADGGANRLFDTSNQNQKNILKPSAIVGDLDSLRLDVRTFYSSQGTSIIEDIDQDYNDVDKSLKYAKSYFDSLNDKSNIEIVIVGAFGGRFDQEIASIHSLYKWGSVFYRIVLMDNENIACLLSPGKHELLLIKGIEGPTCGLLPIGGKVNDVSTKGLKWNLNNQSLSLDGLVSSSNSIIGINNNYNNNYNNNNNNNNNDDDDYVVEIDTSDYVLWTNILQL